MIWQSLLAVTAGFALLVWGADRFVTGAAATARNLGISPLIIGLTIVGFGTSAPEMLVSAVAAWNGNPRMGMGNALGSNITNIGLVLGSTALIMPLGVHSQTLRREFPLLFAVIGLSLVLLLDDELGHGDGLVLLGGMALLVLWMIHLGLRQRGADPLLEEFEEEIPSRMPTGLALGWVLFGLVVLLVSSRVLVWGAVNIAQWLEVDDLIIGLTVVAIGTSLPELAASVVSAFKGEDDIAIGNVLGSNMFNLLAVLGMPGLIAPAAVPSEVLGRDFPVMIGFTLALFAFVYRVGRPSRITRIEGLLLLSGYAAYLMLLYRAVTG